MSERSSNNRNYKKICEHCEHLIPNYSSEMGKCYIRDKGSRIVHHHDSCHYHPTEFHLRFGLRRKPSKLVPA